MGKTARDHAHLQVLEAMIVAILLMGAAYAVLGFRSQDGPTDRTRSELQRLAADAVTVLGGLRDERGLALDADLLEAMHCSADLVPSTTQCSGGAGSNITLKLASYLPTGAAYSITLSNGLRARDVYRVGEPPGEAVSSSIAYAPDWNLTFVLPELSCYDTAMNVNATLLALVNGGLANVTSGNAKLDNGALVNFTNATTLIGARNVTYTSAGRPASGNVTANLTSKRSTLPGFAHYGSCAIGNVTGNAVVNASRNATLSMSGGSVAKVGSSVTFDAGLAPYAGIAGATVGETRLIIFEPIPERRDAPDTWLTALNVTLPTGTTPSYSWSVPSNSTFGVHPVVLSTNITIGATTLQARAVTTITIGLDSGVVPIEPPYRVALQIWIRDWH